jgi:ribonuclease G
MSQSLLISASPGELWAALCEGDEPVELRILRQGTGARVGEIFLARIVALKPEVPAALVELGLERPAFLGAEDTPAKSLKGLREGEAIVVQVTKEARGGKSVNVRMSPRLKGAFLELATGGPTEIALKGLDPAALQRIAADIAALAAKGEGFRLRPEARAQLKTASAAELGGDIAALRARWQAIEAARAAAEPPARLEPEEPLVQSLLAAFAELPRRIVVDDRAVFAEARGFLLRRGEDASRLALYKGNGALFEHEGIAGTIEAALRPRVALAGGASLAIERTNAAVLIDVDSGGAPLMATNLAAAKAVARQIRLRNIAGPIIVDFVAMKDRAQRARVADTLARATEGDPAGPQILGWTRLGHLEMVRKRRHAALDEILYERADGGMRKTAVTVALEALRALARRPALARLLVAPDVANALIVGPAKTARVALEARFGEKIPIEAVPGRAREAFDIVPR